MRRVAFHLIVAAIAWSGRAAADQASTEKESRALFEEARVRIERGDCLGAIPKLRASLRGNPSVGAHLSLAECLEHDDVLAAWRANKDAEQLARAKEDERVAYARSRAALLEPRLAMVLVHLTASLRALPGVDVRVDGARVEPDAPLAVEAKKHVVEAAAPGRRAFRVEVDGVVGVVTTVDVVLEEQQPGNASLLVEGTGLVPEQPGLMQRRLGIFVGAAGVAALAFGTVAGLVVLDKKNDLEGECTKGGGSFPSDCGGRTPPADDVQQQLRSETSSMNAWATVSTIAFAIGGVAVASGAALYLTAPSGPGLRGGFGGIALRGTW